MLTQPQINALAWQKMHGLLPAIIQHADSGEVLMLGYMDQAALVQSQTSGAVTFFSRSKQRLWTKGESSGHTLRLVDISHDCDQDALLVLALPNGPTCHLGNPSCFAKSAGSRWQFLYQLQQLIAERKQASTASSYTARLYASGSKRIAQKVAEEAVETALAATVHNPVEVINESADLLYHLLVLWQDQQVDLAAVIDCLAERHNSH